MAKSTYPSLDSSSSDAKTTTAHSVNCQNCRHYFITWDKNFPKGCKLFNLKSRQFPMQTVKMSSGQDCQGFEQKNRDLKIKI